MDINDTFNENNMDVKSLRGENRKTNRASRNKRYIGYSILSILLFLFIWWLFTKGIGKVKPSVLPDPILVFNTLIRKFYVSNPDGATIQVHILASMQVVLTGFAMGLSVGLPLGILMGWYEKVDIFVRPLFDLIKPIPGIAWVPVFITLFGIGILPRVVVIMLATLIPCLINSYAGIRQTKEVHIWVGQTFGASKFQLLYKVAIPSAIPFILTGMRVALGIGWSTIIGAEMLASTKGLGYLINICRGIYRPDIIIAGMICVGLVGAGLALFLTFLEKQLMKGGRW